MDITLFVVFLAISFIMIILGFYRMEHTELSLIGFVFLFLLSMVILTGSIEHATGSVEVYAYDVNNTANITTTQITSAYTLDSTFSHLVGYWLAIASVIGFAGVLMSITKPSFLRNQ